MFAWRHPVTIILTIAINFALASAVAYVAWMLLREQFGTTPEVSRPRVCRSGRQAAMRRTMPVLRRGPFAARGVRTVARS
jgi:hypothetical protein